MSQNDGDMLRVKELLSMTGASKGLTVDEAAAEIRSEPFYAISEALLNAAVAAIKEEGRMNQVADLPHGVLRHRWKDLLDEQIGEGWYAPIPGTNTHHRTCRLAQRRSYRRYRSGIPQSCRQSR